MSYDDIYQDVSDHVAGFGAQKNESSILSADLDDESLACLFHAGWLAERDNGDSYFGDAYVLILWSRAGFLAAEKPILIDIASDVTVYARERFVPRLSQENLLSLQISVSSTIVACGRSRFLLEAAISLDLEGDDYETLGRQLVLYSANGLLLWRGNSNLDGIHLVPAHEEMLLASSCEGDTSAFLLASQHTVILGEINSDNALEGKTSLVPPECPDQRWSLTCKSLAITSAHTVVAYIAILKVNDLVLKEKVLVSFYPRPAAAVADYTGELQNTIELAGVEKVLQILGFGTEHVLIVGQSSLSVGPTGGHWSRNEDPSELITMHIFHTTSQCQIGCVHLKVAKASVPTFASQGETLVRSHNCTARSPNRNMY